MFENTWTENFVLLLEAIQMIMKSVIYVNNNFSQLFIGITTLVFRHGKAHVDALEA